MKITIKRLVAAIAFIGVLMLACYLSEFSSRNYVLAGRIYDEVNGMPVHGAKVTFGGKTTTIFLLREFILTSVSKGKGTLMVTAPMYHPVQQELTISRKRTEIEVPLQGKDIKGLSGVLVWDRIEADHLFLDIRLVTEDGKAIEFFPALSFGAEVEIYEQSGTDDAPGSKNMLYSGRPALFLDLSSQLEKLKCKIPLDDIQSPQSEDASAMLKFSLHTEQGVFTFLRRDVYVREKKAR